jgi:hypothetical protein
MFHELSAARLKTNLTELALKALTFTVQAMRAVWHCSIARLTSIPLAGVRIWLASLRHSKAAELTSVAAEKGCLYRLRVRSGVGSVA